MLMEKNILSICCFYKIHIYLKKNGHRYHILRLLLRLQPFVLRWIFPYISIQLCTLRGRILRYDAFQLLKEVLIFSNSADPDVIQP